MEKQDLTFILNRNLGFPIEKEPWAGLFSKAGIACEATTDIARIDDDLSAGRPLLAYIPGAAFCVMMRNGNQHYRGLVIATSKFTGQPMQRTLLVVRNDDPAQSLEDLEGAEYGYLNRSCSSSFFPPAILLQQKGSEIDRFFKLKQVPGWQSRVDAVTARAIRATMILEDVWKMTPKNTQSLKIIGEYFPCVPAVLAVRADAEPAFVNTLLERLLRYVPDWGNLYGAFRPYYFADVQTFYHQLSLLPNEVFTPQTSPVPRQ